MSNGYEMFNRWIAHILSLYSSGVDLMEEEEEQKSGILEECPLVFHFV